jgi:alcohol dehydrogenase, propanol-preferring
MKCYCVTHFRAPLEATTQPTPEPAGTQVLLRVKAAGVCHSDVHIWEGGYDLGQGRTLELKDRGVSLPLTLGHETVGTLAAAGTHVNGLDTGHNYLVYPWIGCGQCDYCKQDRENYCSQPACLGIHRPGGGYADHILVPYPPAI